MGARSVDLLVHITLATSVSILFVALLRKPLRALAGTRISYWLWLAVPATAMALLVSVLLPSPAGEPLPFSPPHKAILSALVSSNFDAYGDGYSVIIFSVWLSGVAIMITLFAYRQRSFVRSLGDVHLDSEGRLRSCRIVSPMLVGAWRPKMFLPTNFERLYSEEDRTLMLVHEQAHEQRGDAVANVFAVSWQCLFWFNPVVHWAVARFRFDQELACDALVLAATRTEKSRYASALLKAQLKSESHWRVPIGCHWQSNHPLKERIAMLRHASPALARRNIGAVLTSALVMLSALYFSSAFADSPRSAESASRSTVADKKIAVDADNMSTRDVIAMIARKGNQNVLVSDKVTGKITIHLRDVTCGEALSLVAQSQGLIARQDGGVTLIDVGQ